MAENPMLKFVDQAQAYPEKREPARRAEDFREIADKYAVPSAEEQSARCSQCGVPYCSVHCPLHNHIPDWLRLTDRKSTRLNSSHSTLSRMPSSA